MDINSLTAFGLGNANPAEIFTVLFLNAFGLSIAAVIILIVPLIRRLRVEFKLRRKSDQKYVLQPPFSVRKVVKLLLYVIWAVVIVGVVMITVIINHSLIWGAI